MWLNSIVIFGSIWISVVVAVYIALDIESIHGPTKRSERLERLLISVVMVPALMLGILAAVFIYRR